MASAKRSGRFSAAASPAKGINQTPSGDSSCTCCATARANRVLPIPPSPTSVINRWLAVSKVFLIVFTSSVRPTKGVSSPGKLCFKNAVSSSIDLTSREIGVSIGDGSADGSGARSGNGSGDGLGEDAISGGVANSPVRICSYSWRVSASGDN